jgi:hypothetical protein
MRTSESTKNGYGQVGRTKTADNRRISKHFIDHKRQKLNEESVSLLQRKSLPLGGSPRVVRQLASTVPPPSLSPQRKPCGTMNDVQGVFARSCESSHNCGNPPCMNAPTLSSALSTFRFWMEDARENCRQPDLEGQNMRGHARPGPLRMRVDREFCGTFRCRDCARRSHEHQQGFPPCRRHHGRFCQHMLNGTFPAKFDLLNRARGSCRAYKKRAPPTWWPHCRRITARSVSDGQGQQGTRRYKSLRPPHHPRPSYASERHKEFRPSSTRANISTWVIPRKSGSSSWRLQPSLYWLSY